MRVLQAVGNKINDAFWSHQFWSGFLSSAAANVGISLLNGGLNWLSGDPKRQEDIKKMHELFALGSKFGSEYNFLEALKQFKIAKAHFEKFLLKYCGKEGQAQRLYIDIIFNYALCLTWAGEFNIAGIVLEKLLKNIKKWNSQLYDTEIYKLYGVLYIKNSDFTNAKKFLNKSLTVDPNQPEVKVLKAFVELKETKADMMYLGLKKNLLFILHNGLFKAEIIHPFHFELNYAYLETLYLLDNHELSLKLVREVQDRYGSISLPYQDRIKLHALAIHNIKKLKENLIINETKSAELTSYFESKVEFVIPETAPVIMLANSPYPETVKNMKEREMIIYKKNCVWCYRYKTEAQPREYKVPGDKLLKFLGIKNFNELPSKNQVFYLTYTQQAQLYRKIIKFHDRSVPGKAGTYSKNSNHLLVGIGLAGVAGIAVVKKYKGFSLSSI